LPNITSVAELGLRCCRMSHYTRRRDTGGTLNPLCLVAASDHRATRELVQNSWMATMGVLHGYYVAEYLIICRDGARGTLNPLCLVTASDNRDTRELVQSSLVATMGVLHGYDVAECRIICGDGARGAHSTHSAWWLLAIIEIPESWYRARGWRRWEYCMAIMLPNIALFAGTGQGGHSTHSAW
jgi:hypothetical protein